MESLDSDIKYIVDSINDYVNGNDSEENYNIILDVVDSLHEYIKLTKKNKMRAMFVFLISRIATYIDSPLLVQEDLYKELIKSCKTEYDFYLESVKKLKEYVKECKSRGEYPNLDAAYLLTINLSLVFSSCMKYTSYIRTLESCYNSGIAFEANINSNGSTEKEEVKRLIMRTDSAIEELRKRED